MIQIRKGNILPKLAIEGPLQADTHKKEYDNYPAEYSSGKMKFKITDAYKTDEIKDELIKLQHNKCCFSEAKLLGDYGDVEHFRPKGRIDEYPAGKQFYPGYYWLAYDWSNLFLCKQIINVSFKRNYFPLLDESKRNHSHHDCNSEDPVIIDPCAEDPRNHIQFYLDEPIHITKKGEICIKLLGLRHSHFEEARRKYFQILQRIKDVVDIAVSKGVDINDPMLNGPLLTLREAIQPDAQFSSMAIDLLQGWPHL